MRRTHHTVADTETHSTREEHREVWEPREDPHWRPASTWDLRPAARN